MFRATADLFRLARAGLVLARHDALVPREHAAAFPPAVRLFGSLTRIIAKGQGRRALRAALRTATLGRRGWGTVAGEARPGQRLARALAGQGPGYVKFGQLLATRPDIVGAQLAADLSELQDRMPPFPTEAARAEIERSLGRPVPELFADLSGPVAAASIAQVHKGRLASGEAVAVKVLRPGVEGQVAREFRAFRRGARIAERLVPASRRMRPVAFIDTLRASADVELDLRLEAGAASEMAETFGDDPRVRVPRTHWALSSRRVLTTEWVDGTPVHDTPALDRMDADRPALAVLAMRTFLTSALEHGLFHADMHQGNLFVDAEGRLVLIDFGIMGRLSRDSRSTFARIIYGFIRRDYAEVSRAHFEAGWIDERYDQATFATAMRSVGEPIFGRTADDMDMSRVLQQLFDVTEVFDMHLRTELVLLQRTMVVVEGVARVLDPKIDLWATAEPVVRGYVERQVGPRAALRILRENGRAAAELFREFPEFARAAENVAGQLANGGLKLSDETVEKLAAAMRDGRGDRV